MKVSAARQRKDELGEMHAASHLLHLPPPPSIQPINPLAHIHTLPSKRRCLPRHVSQAAGDSPRKATADATVHEQSILHAHAEPARDGVACGFVGCMAAIAVAGTRSSVAGTGCHGLELRLHSLPKAQQLTQGATGSDRRDEASCDGAVVGQ